MEGITNSASKLTDLNSVFDLAHNHFTRVPYGRELERNLTVEY